MLPLEYCLRRCLSLPSVCPSVFVTILIGLLVKNPDLSEDRVPGVVYGHALVVCYSLIPLAFIAAVLAKSGQAALLFEAATQAGQSAPRQAYELHLAGLAVEADLEVLRGLFEAARRQVEQQQLEALTATIEGTRDLLGLEVVEPPPPAKKPQATDEALTDAERLEALALNIEGPTAAAAAAAAAAGAAADRVPFRWRPSGPAVPLVPLE
eukprot:SAG22_NODE_1779_length_3600_cov_3.511568_1_plen_209_part_10